MKDFLVVGNQAINLDHVTDVRFYPTSKGINEETDEEYDIAPSIEMVMTSTETDVLCTFETVDGVAAISRVLKFKGEVAEKIWNRIKGAFDTNVIEDTNANQAANYHS